MVILDRQSVSEVILPPWAKTPHEFIQINRAALGKYFMSYIIYAVVQS